MLEWMRRQRSSIQAQFLLYSLALLVPALVFSGLMFLRSAAFERAGMEREIKDVAHSVAAAIDRELAARITTLKALASSPSLAEGDLKAFYQQAMAAQEGGEDYFILTNRAGKQLVNTRIPFGDPLPETSADNWEEVFETGKTQVSNLYQGTADQVTAARGPAFNVSVPVEKRKKILYALSASIAPERILDILKRETLRPGWVATVTDRAGVVIARSQDSEKFLGRTLPRDRATGAEAARRPLANSRCRR